MAVLPPLVEHLPSEDTVLRKNTDPQIPLTPETMPTPRKNPSLGKNNGVLLEMPGSGDDATLPVHMPSPATGPPTDATGPAPRSALSLPAGPYGQSKDWPTARTTMVANFQRGLYQTIMTLLLTLRYSGADIEFLPPSCCSVCNSLVAGIFRIDMCPCMGGIMCLGCYMLEGTFRLAHWTHHEKCRYP